MTRTCRCCASPYANPFQPRAERSKGHYAGYRGYCPACYKRWADHGYPAGGPPLQRTGTGPKAGRAGRIEDYAWLRLEQGYDAVSAAIRLGVTRRTAQRYEAALRSDAA